MQKLKASMKDLFLDWKRYDINFYNPIIFIAKFFHNPGMIFSLFYRIEKYLIYDQTNKILKYLGYFFYPVYFFVTYYILSYHIEPVAKIEGGLFLHNRDIVITNNVNIGKNFSIMGQTTIGTDFGCAETLYIGNDVKMGVGAKIIFSKSLTIGNNVVIGANAVVVKDIPSDVVVGGVPAKIIKYTNKN